MLCLGVQGKCTPFQIAEIRKYGNTVDLVIFYFSCNACIGCGIIKKHSESTSKNDNIFLKSVSGLILVSLLNGIYCLS